MAPEWAMQFGMDQTAVFGAAGAAPAYMYGMPAAETMRVDDLLDFTNHELLPSNSSSSSSSVAADANLLVMQNQVSPAADFGRAFGFGDGDSAKASFTDDIYITSEEVAELEWLSKFVEDSFSDVPLQSLPYTETMAQSNVNIHRADVSAATGRGARSKRSRGVAIAGELGAGVQHYPSASAWPSSSSLALSPTTTSSSSSSDFPTTNGGSRKKQGGMDTGLNGGEVRRCTHCASEKTPQWRTGPLGPKTLCNACGVRYKSGRLVPEYRPAASPTFVLTQHSNSHRKVMELRRHKELLILHHHEDASSVAASSTRFSSAVARPQLLFHDYDVC